MRIKPNTLVFTGLLAGISALPPLSIDMNLPAIPDIESFYQVAAGQGALTLSLFLLGFAFAPLIGGPLSDRYGRKKTLLLALVVTSAAAFACAIPHSFRQLLLFRMIQGTSAGVCILAPLAIVRDTLSGYDIRRQYSRIMFVVGIAPLLAPIIGAWVLEHSGWRSVYGIQGAFGTLLLIIIMTCFSETLPADRRIPFNLRQLVQGYKTVFTTRSFLGFAFLRAFAFGCMFSYISGSPGLLLGQLHVSSQTYSLIFAFTACGLMVGSFCSDRLGGRAVASHTIISHTLVILLATVSGALALSLTGLVHLITIVPLIFITMIGFGLMMPNATAEAMEELSHIAGTASGALNALQMLMGAAASGLVTTLSGYVNPGLAMTNVMAGSILLAAVVYYLARASKQKG